MKFEKMGALAAAVSMIFLFAAVTLAGELHNLEIVPSDLEINAFYSGQQVNISGRIPSDRDVFIEIKGPVQSNTFNMKGKVGPLWMNTKKITVGHVPFLYLVLCPPKGECRRRAASLGVGLQTLKNDITVQEDDVSTDEIFNRLVQLKHSEQLYAEIDDAIEYATGAGGEKAFSAGFFLPSAIAPAEYSIVITLVHDGAVEKTIVRNMQIKEAGVVKYIRRLANHRELIYGISCVVIALLAGLVMGLLFKGSDSH